MHIYEEVLNFKTGEYQYTFRLFDKEDEEFDEIINDIIEMGKSDPVKIGVPDFW